MESITQTEKAFNYKRDKKANRKGEKGKSAKFDQCQTPGYALDPILPYLKPGWTIWESACGSSQLVNKLIREGFQVIGTDVLSGYDFFAYQSGKWGDWSLRAKWDCQITNLPFSLKYPWLKRSYELGKPFALLAPVEALGAARAQSLFKKYGVEIVLLNRRVNFSMPNKGYTGGGAQFPVCWYTWNLDIGQPLTYASISYYDDSQIPLFEPNYISLDFEAQLSLPEVVA